MARVVSKCVCGVTDVGQTIAFYPSCARHHIRRTADASIYRKSTQMPFGLPVGAGMGKYFAKLTTYYENCRKPPGILIMWTHIDAKCVFCRFCNFCLKILLGNHWGQFSNGSRTRFSIRKRKTSKKKILHPCETTKSRFSLKISKYTERCQLFALTCAHSNLCNIR